LQNDKILKVEYNYFQINIASKIATVTIDRADKANALNIKAWEELRHVFETLDKEKEARVIILNAAGKHFCSGMDIAALMDIAQVRHMDCQSRMREAFREKLFALQAAVTSLEKCQKPVLVSIHGACIGGGIDLVTAGDIRYATKDAKFSIKEVDMGLVADMGTLQRLPKLISPALVAELAYTGRNMSGEEAEKVAMVNKAFDTKEDMESYVLKIAEAIASKSPVVIRGTKNVLKYSRDHSVEDALNYVTTWNAGMIFSNDIMEAMAASFEKREAKFED